jgi:hypothetical protein
MSSTMDPTRGIKMSDYFYRTRVAPNSLPLIFQWIYRGDDWLLVRRWEQLIAMRRNIDIVQFISWNGVS